MRREAGGWQRGARALPIAQALSAWPDLEAASARRVLQGLGVDAWPAEDLVQAAFAVSAAAWRPTAARGRHAPARGGAILARRPLARPRTRGGRSFGAVDRAREGGRLAAFGADARARAPLRAVVFDFDGTLVDTEMLQYKAWRRAIARAGSAFALDDWRSAVGKAPDAFDPVALVEAREGRPLHRAHVEAEAMRELERSLAGARLRPGIGAWLEDAAARGLALAVASNSSADWVYGLLDRLGLTRLFAAVATADQVALPKPAPDLYELAVARLGVSAAGALAVEDSPLGAEAALAAGLRCVVVPNVFTRPFTFPLGAERRATFGPPPWRAGPGDR
jgi:HAD superfamily hydrolase (TIGR01509 family)